MQPPCQWQNSAEKAEFCSAGNPLERRMLNNIRASAYQIEVIAVPTWPIASGGPPISSFRFRGQNDVLERASKEIR
jgi:L-rhamnose isomerase